MAGAASALRRTFVQGILLLLPLAITFVVLRWLFLSITGLTAPVVESTLRGAGSTIVESELFPYLSPLLGVVITIALVLAVGLVGGNYVGKRAWAFFEQLVLKLPLVRWFYGSVRQLMDAFGAGGSGAFREVVYVEYPRRGVWCLGFVTASAGGRLPDGLDHEPVFVYLPTTPNPTSGYTILVARDDLVAAGMTVDEGIKLIVSGGFIAPKPRPPATAATP